MVNRIPFTIPLVLGAVMLLGACAERSESGGAPPPDSPVTSTPSPGGPQPGPTPLLITPRPGLADPRPLAWESVDLEGDRTLLIQFYGGVEECYGLDHVEVHYGADEVTVTLYQGRVPSAGVCIEMVVLKVVRVELREPLDGRKVVDGSTPEA
jgi:hypothetical protein